ncbi:6-phosphogluconolactonase [Schistosoma japonicum]|nr:6-phosphogluconolactonase [Schistosoma japonicum]
MILNIRDDKSDVGQCAFEIINDVLLKSTEHNRTVTIGLSGGSMPHLLAPHLCSISEINWGLVHFFYCDERLVPLDSEDSNHHSYYELLFSKINIPSSNIHTPVYRNMHTNCLVEDAAVDYQKQILSFFGTANGYPRFDLLLLGMGPDGHTCSLFPDHKLLYYEDFVVAPISDSPKPPPERVTLTIPVINKAAKVVFIVTGSDKAHALKSVHQASNPGPSMPCSLIHPVYGELIWIVDKAAASLLNT